MPIKDYMTSENKNTSSTKRDVKAYWQRPHKTKTANIAREQPHPQCLVLFIPQMSAGESDKHTVVTPMMEILTLF